MRENLVAARSNRSPAEAAHKRLCSYSSFLSDREQRSSAVFFRALCPQRFRTFLRSFLSVTPFVFPFSERERERERLRPMLQVTFWLDARSATPCSPGPVARRDGSAAIKTARSQRHLDVPRATKIQRPLRHHLDRQGLAVHALDAILGVGAHRILLRAAGGEDGDLDRCVPIEPWERRCWVRPARTRRLHWKNEFAAGPAWYLLPASPTCCAPAAAPRSPTAQSGSHLPHWAGAGRAPGKSGGDPAQLDLAWQVRREGVAQLRR